MSKLILIALIVFGVWLLLLKPAHRSARRPAPQSPKRPQYAEAEARSLLGVGAEADDEAIRAAHRRLVNAVHPDKGGSADLTGRINAARDVLLKR